MIIQKVVPQASVQTTEVSLTALSSFKYSPKEIKQFHKQRTSQNTKHLKLLLVNHQQILSQLNPHIFTEIRHIHNKNNWYTNHPFEYIY